jgi:4-amino-4-deoxy-L-arabinose transferase-like glycosyltransferase
VALIVGVRLLALDQPIVENYVGRQIPSAMVARNLDRGSGFLFPQLDTAPFPSLFVVEPPVYQELVCCVARAFRLPIEQAGRAVSALAVGLGAIALYRLARPRSGQLAATLATLAFGAMPVTLRYGRAFQPDALALGLVLAGVMLWDDWRQRGGWLRADLAWTILALGLAVKLLWVFVVLPVGWLVAQRLASLPGGSRARRSLALALILASMLVPAALWYTHAARCLVGGARASSVNASVWLAALAPGALFSLETWIWIARFGLVRAFSILGVALAAWGLFRSRAATLWRLWTAGGLVTLLVVAAKLHHEYYWLLVAPAVAVGIGEGLGLLLANTRTIGARLVWCGLLAVLVGLGGFHARSTWSTPPEWSDFAGRGRRLAGLIPPQALVIGREAVLYAADRRGMRMEREPDAIVRAFGEWGVPMPREEATPQRLASWYHQRGARYYAEMSDPQMPTPLFPGDPALVDRILAREPGLLVLQLTEPVHGEPDGSRAPRPPIADR